MSFPRYPAYRDSGVDWLGEVPKHWPDTKIKTIASFSGGGTPSREILAYWNGDIPWVSPKDMKGECIVGAEESISEEGMTNSASNLLPPGRVLMVVRSGILKHTIPVAINAVPVALNQDMKALSFDLNKCESRFFLRWVQGHNDQLLRVWANQGATVESIQQSLLANTEIPLPDIAEQAQIASFLDRETAKIDALVAEQGKLIALLKEKRQAVISHAVTKGLDPSVSMRDSGVEWLGEAPAHWKLKRLKYLGQAITGLTYSPADIVDDEESGTLVLRSSNVQRGVITLDDNVYVSAVIPCELVTRVGDILICSRNGSRALIGKNATIDEASSGLTFGAFMTVFRSQSCAYLSWVLNSPLFEFQSGAFMTSTINQLTLGVLNGFEVPLPPEDEQAQIAAFLAVESNKFDTLTAEAQHAITLLQERRTALISAAVTGKIDVRHFAAMPA